MPAPLNRPPRQFAAIVGPHRRPGGRCRVTTTVPPAAPGPHRRRPASPPLSRRCTGPLPVRSAAAIGGRGTSAVGLGSPRPADDAGRRPRSISRPRVRRRRAGGRVTRSGTRSTRDSDGRFGLASSRVRRRPGGRRGEAEPARPRRRQTAQLQRQTDGRAAPAEVVVEVAVEPFEPGVDVRGHGDEQELDVQWCQAEVLGEQTRPPGAAGAAMAVGLQVAGRARRRGEDPVDRLRREVVATVGVVRARVGGPPRGDSRAGPAAPPRSNRATECSTLRRHGHRSVRATAGGLSPAARRGRAAAGADVRPRIRPRPGSVPVVPQPAPCPASVRRSATDFTTSPR